MNMCSRAVNVRCSSISMETHMLRDVVRSFSLHSAKYINVLHRCLCRIYKVKKVDHARVCIYRSRILPYTDVRLAK